MDLRSSSLRYPIFDLAKDASATVFFDTFSSAAICLKLNPSLLSMTQTPKTVPSAC